MNYEHFQKEFLIKNKIFLKDIFLVNMTKEEDFFYSELMLKGIEKVIKQKGNIAIIVNKKGYSSGIICKKCGYIPQCNNCSVSIAYHKINPTEKVGLCHICKSQYSIPTICKECWWELMNEYGKGIQQIQERCYNTFKIDAKIIETRTVNSPKKIEKLQSEIVWDNHISPSEKKAEIFIGTGLLNTAIAKKPIDLVVFLDADIWLNIPDYNANKNNFHFLYDTFVNYQDTKNFIVQTRNPYQESIRYACKGDNEWFQKFDLKFKEQQNYPPFADLCIIMYKDEIEQKLFNKVDKLYKELLYLKEKYQMKELEIYSTPPLIYKIFWKYRYNIILKWKKTRDFMDIVYSKLELNKKWFKIDRMAESIV